MKPQHGNLQTLSLEATKVWSPPASPWDPPMLHMSLLGKYRGMVSSPKWHPDPALAQADEDKTTKVVTITSLLLG